MAPTGHIGSHPVHVTTQLFGFLTTVLFLPSLSSVSNTLMWQKLTHFPHVMHFWYSIDGYQGILFLGIPCQVSSAMLEPLMIENTIHSNF